MRVLHYGVHTSTLVIETARVKVVPVPFLLNECDMKAY
jgi:hypothetical protein